MWWQEAVSTLKGIGKKRVAAFEKLHVATIGDLLNFYPRLDSYIDNSQVLAIRNLATDGSKQLFKGELLRTGEHYSRQGGKYSILTLRDASGYAEVYLFGGQRFQSRTYKLGTELLIAGRVRPGRMGKVVTEALVQPYDAQHLAASQGILPVYNLTEALTQPLVRQAVRQALQLAAERGCPETLPELLVKQYGFLGRLETLVNIHFPESKQKLDLAKQRLIYEELFLLQCGLLLNKEQNGTQREGLQHRPNGPLVRGLLQGLPFQLTKAQGKAWKEIARDMEKPQPMHRLLQGDVGSGKTVISALALAKTVENGFQGCIMAPTGILAGQHYETLQSFFAGTKVRLALLTSMTKPAQRRNLLEDLALGLVDILIGTHAVLQEDVRFAKLALVVTDEQHRFGVNQRAALVNKAPVAPDVLIMTATPIPRTLALTVYGDVDVSLMQGLPPGRKAVTTLCYTGDKREQVYAGMLRQLKAGRQAYVVCASIEESEEMEVRSVTEVFEELTQSFLRDVPCALLHGKLKNAEKDDIMERFAKGELKALVTTTVIEVGVNVPNATLMIVEDADRFGLAQLHQLRGRVGRGDKQSYCVLLTDSQAPETLARLQVLHACNDGFELSERDLELRGSGQLFGLKQHGLPDLYIADILRDKELLQACRQDAQNCLAKPALRQEVLQAVREQFDERFAGIFNF